MICISAGHHPTKPGACYEGFCEHDEAVRWVDEICSHLGESCLKVPATTLKEKVAFINARMPRAAIEIHFNAARVWEDLDKNGIQDVGEVRNVGKGALTLYYPGSKNGLTLATAIQGNLETLFDRHWNGVMEGWYRMNKKFGPDYFLEKTRCPAIIIEPEFIHRKDIIQNKRKEACIAIATTLKEFYNV